MKIRLASTLQSDSVVDGSGIRTVIWTQGCSHNCPSCHNPGTHDFNGGVEVDVEEIKQEISNLKNQTGITFSGGDPVFQIDALIELSKFIKELNMNIWVYTGFTYEQVLELPKGREMLEFIDVLVDGKFDISKKTLDAPFRGSSNQRIIDVQESLKTNNVVLIESLMKKKDIKPLYKKPENIFI